MSKRKSGNVAAAVNRYQLLHRPTSSLNNSTKVGRLHKAARQGRGPQDAPSPVHTSDTSDTEMGSASDTVVNKLFERFEAFEASFPAVLERSLQGLKTEFQESLARSLAAFRAETTQQVAEATQQAQVARQEAQRLRAEFSALQDKYAGLESRVEGADRAARAANLVVHGLKEEEGDVHAKICSMFPAVQGPSIVEATRLGRPTATTGDLAGTSRPRPVRVRFATVQAKHQALQAGKDLRSRQLYVDVDLTPLQQQAKRARRDHYIALKQQGLRPFWRAERIFFVRDGRVVEDLGQATPATPAPTRQAQTPLPNLPNPPRSVPAGGARTSRSYRDATAAPPTAANRH